MQFIRKAYIYFIMEVEGDYQKSHGFKFVKMNWTWLEQPYSEAGRAQFTNSW